MSQNHEISKYFYIEFPAIEATLTMPYHEIECIVAYFKNFEKEDLPETIREEILPKMEDFLIDNY